MSEENGVERTLGKLLASVENLEAGMGEMKNTLSAHGKKIDAMQSKFDQQKGGWKALTIVGGIAGAVGAVIGKALLPF